MNSHSALIVLNYIALLNLCQIALALIDCSTELPIVTYHADLLHLIQQVECRELGKFVRQAKRSHLLYALKVVKVLCLAVVVCESIRLTSNQAAVMTSSDGCKQC